MSPIALMLEISLGISRNIAFLLAGAGLAVSNSAVADTPAHSKEDILRDLAGIASEGFKASWGKAETELNAGDAAWAANQQVEACGHYSTQITEALSAESWAAEIGNLAQRLNQPQPDVDNALTEMRQFNDKQLANYKQKCLPLYIPDPNSQINASRSLSSRISLIQWYFDDALRRLRAANIEANDTSYDKDGEKAGACFDAGIANKRLDAALGDIREFEGFAKPAGVDMKDINALHKDADTAKGIAATMIKDNCPAR